MRQPPHEPHCPRCSYPLHHVDLAQSSFDLCHRCGGKFAPPGALAEHYGEGAHPSSWATSHIADDLGDRPLHCPHDGAQLHAFNVSFDDDKVEVDACPTCHGLWLDRGEGDRLATIVQSADATRFEKEIEAHTGRAYLFQLFTGMPLEVYNPVGKRPLVVWTLIALNIVAFGIEVALLNAGVYRPRAFGEAWGLVANAPEGVTFLTHMFLHGGLLHLLGNLYTLYIFGDNIEDRYGRGRFLLMYFVSGLAGALLHVVVLSDTGIPVIGASGAIAGVTGAYLVAYPRTQLWMVVLFIRFKLSVYVYMAFWVALQVLGAWVGGHSVAWWVHLGGFTAGVGFGLWFRRSESVWGRPAP